MKVPVFWKKKVAYLMRYKMLKRLMMVGIRLVVPSQRIGVSIVVFDEAEQVLLLRHVFHPDVPWGLPGGWLGNDEAPHQGALRELQEETGLTAVVGPVVYTGHEQNPSHIGIVFLGYVVENHMRLSGEVLEAKWFAVDDLPHPFYAFSYKAILAALQIHRALPQKEGMMPSHMIDSARNFQITEEEVIT